MTPRIFDYVHQVLQEMSFGTLQNGHMDGLTSNYFTTASKNGSSEVRPFNNNMTDGVKRRRPDDDVMDTMAMEDDDVTRK